MQSSENTKHWQLYVLKLAKDKWYVGITPKDPEAVFNTHKSGKGNAWTKKYKPEKLSAVKDLGELPTEKAEVLEDRIMRKYVKQYGANNVRGGYLDGLDNVQQKSPRFKFKLPTSEGQVLVFAFIEAIVIVVLLLQRMNSSS